MKNETLTTIAQRTGVSATTVSRVLSGNAKKYRISKKTADKITREAQRSNFVPSILAQGLRMRKSHAIGLLVPGLDNPYFANIASMVVQEAKKSGYTVVLADSMESEENEREGMTSLLSRRVDGVIVVPSGTDPGFFERIDRSGTPVVLIDRYFDHSSLSYVCTNNYQGGFDATQYLIDHGHTNILCIRGIPYSMPSRERERGYFDALERNGYAHLCHIVGSDFSIRNGYLETMLALKRPEPPTAIFAMSNTILLGAVKAIREARLSIPENVSVISFDNNIYLDYLDPAITRISQPTNEISTLAIKLLMQRIEGGSEGGVEARTTLQLSPQLITCNSVRRL